MTVLPTFPGSCAWCGEPASERVHVSGRGMSKIYALACAEHAQGKKRHEVSSTRAARQQREPEVLERTEPLCRSCGAEVIWVTLPRNGKRMCVDRRPIHTGDPRPSLVLVDAKKGAAVVLKRSDIDSGAAKRRLDGGARLHMAHFATCPSAARHRKQRKAVAA